MQIKISLVLTLTLLLTSVCAYADLKITQHIFSATLTDEEMEEGHYVNPHAGGDGGFYEQDLMQLGVEYGPKGADDVDISSSYLLNFGNGSNFDRYLLTPIRFMEAKKEGEACTPIKNTYRCKQGQPYTQTCFLAVAEHGPYPKLNDAYPININESSPIYCSAFSAVGIYDKKQDQFLVTVRYFPIQAFKPTRNESAMTVLFKAKKIKKGADSSVELIQLDSCLGNPNRIDNIPEARKRLRQCGIAK